MKRPSVVTSRDGDSLFWKVGDASLSVSPARRGWDARVHCPEWGDNDLSLCGHFASEAAAVAWCDKMAATLARDQADD